jgi:Family of unknown function (DUF6291)
MAEGKNTVVVYKDWRDYFSCLSDDEAGKLIKHFFDYVNDDNPIAKDRITEISFNPIKLALKRDLSKWDKTLANRSKAGKASAEAKKIGKQNQQSSTHSTRVDFVEENSTHSTDTVTDTVTVSTYVDEKEKKAVAEVLEINHDSFSKECLESEQWLEVTSMQLKIPKDKMKFALEDFNKHLISIGVQKKKSEKTEYKTHFKNWVTTVKLKNTG